MSRFARPELDVGRVGPDTRLEGMSLLLKPSFEQKARSERVLRELSDPLSGRYHRWLKPAEYGAAFGASASDLASAVSWLRSQGFTVHGPSPTGTRILFSGTVGQLEAAFFTEMHYFNARGAKHFALAAPPAVPADMGRYVLGLRGVHDFKMRPAIHAPPRGTPRPADLFDGGASKEVLTMSPSDFATIYDVNPLYAAGITGKGQKIGIMGEGDFYDADVIAFRTLYGLDTSLVPVRDQVPLSGSSVVSPYVYGETILDLEWSGAIGKEATVAYVYTGDNPAYGVYDSVAWAIEEGTYPVLSLSYGDCETVYTPAEDIYLQWMGDAASMEGITLLNAAGDLGPATCDYDPFETAATQGLAVSYPASIPSVVAVGGTMFNWGDPVPEAPITPAIASASPFDTYWTCSFSGSASCAPTGYVPESAWNEINYEISTLNYFWGAGCGGISTLFAKPYWQVGVTPKGKQRLLPDVSLSAAWAQVGYLVSQSFAALDGGDAQPEALQVTGGTSAASPSLAGILSLLNQALAAKNPTLPVGLGNANPMLYAINASTSGTAAAAFHDITTGDTYVPCAPGTPDCPASPPYQYGYAAGPGYDMATGIGSIDANNLVAAWTSLTPTSTTLLVTPTSTTEGSGVAVTATVASTATATAMTGSVEFYVDTVDEAGTPDLAKSKTTKLTATFTGGHEGGTATATVLVPPGLLEKANIVAFYAGDSHYLASWSTATSVSVSSTLMVSPGAPTLSPNQQQVFTTSGGTPPIAWTIVRDTTCSGYYSCAQIESTSATEGTYQAGGADGTTEIAAIDADGAEVRVLVTVTGAPVDGGVLPPPWDASADSPSDSSSDALGDVASDAVPSEAAPPKDATTKDAATADSTLPRDGGGDASDVVDAPLDAPGHPDAHVHHEAGPGEPGSEPVGGEAEGGAAGGSGCSCRAAGGSGGPQGGGAPLAIGSLALAFGRRRRRRT